MYSVIKFIESENQVECVPSSWLCSSGEEVQCKWPRNKSRILTSIKKNELPEEDWTHHRIKIMVSNVDYETGRKKSKVAEDTSNLEDSDIDVKKRKRKLVYNRNATPSPLASEQLFGNSDDEDSDKSVIETPTKFLTCEPTSLRIKAAEVKSKNSKNIEGTSILINTAEERSSQCSENLIETPSSMRSSTPNITQDLDPSTGIQELLNLIYRNLESKMQNLEQILKLNLKLTIANEKELKMLVSQNANMSDRLSVSIGINPQFEQILKSMPDLPVNSMDEFIALETFLNESKDHFDALVSRLKNGGGSDAVSFAKLSMERLLTNSAGKLFNMAGRSSSFSKDDSIQKVAFQESKSFKAIIAAMKLNKSTEDEDPMVARKKIKAWLQMSAYRKGGGGRN